jgi:hypothetical protein
MINRGHCLDDASDRAARYIGGTTGPSRSGTSCAECRRSSEAPKAIREPECNASSAPGPEAISLFHRYLPARLRPGVGQPGFMTIRRQCRSTSLMTRFSARTAGHDDRRIAQGLPPFGIRNLPARATCHFQAFAVGAAFALCFKAVARTVQLCNISCCTAQSRFDPLGVSRQRRSARCR